MRAISDETEDMTHVGYDMGDDGWFSGIVFGAEEVDNRNVCGDHQ